MPDGLAFGPPERRSGSQAAPERMLYLGCYEPSQILRIRGDGTVETVAHDPTAHTLCHPTNIAFRDDGLLVAANLGRWHLTAVDAEERTN